MKIDYSKILKNNMINVFRDVLKIIEKIVLCDVQNKIYPNIERIFINLLTDSGYPGIKIQKKVDFEELYKKRSN